MRWGWVQTVWESISHQVEQRLGRVLTALVIEPFTRPTPRRFRGAMYLQTHCTFKDVRTLETFQSPDERSKGRYAVGKKNWRSAGSLATWTKTPTTNLLMASLGSTYSGPAAVCTNSIFDWRNTIGEWESSGFKPSPARSVMILGTWYPARLPHTNYRSSILKSYIR